MEFSKFKESELLEIINAGAKKKEIIQTWSPYINTFWSSFGPRMVDRRRSELNLFLAPDKEIPTLVKT